MNVRRFSLRFVPAMLGLLAATGAWAASKSRDESLLIFDNRKVSVAVPEEFTFRAGRDQDGVPTVRVAPRTQKVSLDIRFLADPEQQLAGARARKELINDMFSEYVSSSTEGGLQFEELEPRFGAGTYCVFTDSKLVGKKEFPPGEYLHLTAGVKAWPGVVAVFRCFSNDTTSPEYQAVMKLLRESVQEVPVPLR